MGFLQKNMQKKLRWCCCVDGPYAVARFLLVWIQLHTNGFRAYSLQEVRTAQEQSSHRFAAYLEPYSMIATSLLSRVECM